MAVDLDALNPPERKPLVVAGRYQIVPEGGTDTKAHTRVTNFAKKLEDDYLIMEWSKRMVLLGAAQRPDITLAALAAADDRNALNGISADAIDAAKGNVKREIGTALHSLCEQVDAGQEVKLPPIYQEAVEAYRACLRDIGATVERMEEVVVVPDLKLAGRFDRLVSIGGNRFVLDLKTGTDLSHSWLSISIQLALYAQAKTIYHHDTQTHEPMPEVSQSHGIVVHLEAEKAKATPYWVDLAAGRQGVELTKSVLAWRKTKGVVTIADGLRGQMRKYVVARVKAILDAGRGADLGAHWPLGVPTLRQSDQHSGEQYDAILAVCAAVEAKYRLPFPDVTDPRSH